MFTFEGSPVPVRHDLRHAYRSTWHHFAHPGPTLSGSQRIETLRGMRSGATVAAASLIGIPDALAHLADTVYSSPTALNGTIVGTAIEAAGEFMTVEVIALASMLASVDGTHRGLGARLEPLPEPVAGKPTGEVAEGLKRRRTHVPVPPGPIPFVLDLLPAEGAAYQALFGPQYMTGPEMMMNDFRRLPHGLDRAQMECVSARTSIHNECFY